MTTHRSARVKVLVKADTRVEFRVVTRFVPTTFLERGVAIPFTTPQLAGARARPGERTPLEIIVPNPSGGRGVYILPWGNVDGLCKPTLHDRLLTEAVSALRGVTPEVIRHTARDIAVRGVAGRGAREAAQRARENEKQACVQANFDLLLEVVRQAEPPGENPIPPEQEPLVALEGRAKRAVARIAVKLRWSAETIVERLEQIAACFGTIGTGGNARISASIVRLSRVRGEVAEYLEQADSRTRLPDETRDEAGLITSTAHLTVHMTKATLADAQALPGDIVGLLQRWAANPDSILRLLARPDWLLDGWDRICAMWELAPASGATIADMAALVPVVPREADEWLHDGRGRPADPSHYGRKLVRQLEDWRTGVAVCDLVAQNEALLAKIL